MSVRLLTSTHPSGLPSPLSPLVGRTHEIAAATSFLAEPSVRLLTLTGPGGTGKTRLALRVAADVSDDYADGVLFVPLAAIRDPDLLVPTIARAAGLTEPVSSSIEDALTEYLAARNTLLVLDNFEQIIAAGVVVARLLEQCANVKALVTSRSPLQTAGEQRFPVAPLSLPSKNADSLESLRQSEAVELFLQRVRAIGPNLALTERDAPVVAEICWRLDGLPLALELAAARTNVLSLPALLARLSDRLHLLVGDRLDVPERLRTMRQAIAWSYDLLPPVEQSIFRRASVFSGGAAIEALEVVANQPAISTHAFLDALGRLVDHSLMRREDDPERESRIAMLETLREFGLEQLRALGEETAVRDAHAAYLLTYVEAGEPRMRGHGQTAWLDELDAEQGNLRAALDWTLQTADAETALRICAAVWRYWMNRGRFEEGRAWVDRALEAGASAPSPARLGALIASAFLAEDHADYEAAQTRFEQAASLAESTGDQLTLAQAWDGLGTVASDRGEFSVASDHHVRAAALAREIGDERMASIATANLGSVHYRHADFDRAEQCWLECRALVRAQGDLHGEALMTGNLGALAVMRGDLQQGEALLTEALALQRELRHPRTVASCLVNLGDIRMTAGDVEAASSHFDEAFAIMRETGDPHGAAVIHVRIAKAAHARGDIAAARATFAESIRALVESGDRFALMEATEELALLLVQDGDARPAARLYGMIDALRDELASSRREPEQPAYDASITRLRAELDGAQFDEARAAGARMAPRELAMMVAALPRPPAPAPAPKKPVVRIEASRPRLSDRELDVLRLVAAGCSNREIADALFISPRTASTHVEHILSKLSVNTRSAAVAVAMREGLV